MSSDSEDSEAPIDPAASLTRWDLQRLLKETSAAMKAYTASELEKHIAGLRGDIEALSTCTCQAETRITGLTHTTKAQQQEIYAMQD
ncbi:Hypothetical predicted protein [Pelobates cultripes]|uniref:Uncharacterized protein n=1 Tax=Pelobates cultripes TaxID=61616 RepID=A0AAD1S558_PELCU|nr:Hypothetical predicted protein [Pelobates cultripes]